MLPMLSNMRHGGIIFGATWMIGLCVWSQGGGALKCTGVGLEIDYIKSLLVPTQQIIWIGFDLDFRQGIIRVRQDKMQSIPKDLDRLRRAPVVSIHRCASVLGRVR